MRLPHPEQAFVPRDKVERYLLSEAHPDGRGKAAFFRGFGFSADDWMLLREALLEQVREHHVAAVDTSAFGTRALPRFVTAYPLRKERDDDS